MLLMTLIILLERSNEVNDNTVNKSNESSGD